MFNTLAGQKASDPFWDKLTIVDDGARARAYWFVEDLSEVFLDQLSAGSV